MKVQLFFLLFVTYFCWSQGEVPVFKGKLKLENYGGFENKPEDLSIAISNKIDFTIGLPSKEDAYLKRFSMLNKSSEQKSIMEIELPTVDFNEDRKNALNDKLNPKRESDKKSNVSINYGYIEIDAPQARIVCRDFGAEDGDLISLKNNGEIVLNSFMITNAGKTYFIALKDGENRLVFTALNEGYSSPNTAEFSVYDDVGNLIYSNQWNLDTGNTASLVLLNKKTTIAPPDAEESKEKE